MEYRKDNYESDEMEEDVCFYLETVAADGLVTGTRIKAVMKAGSSGHKQAAHFRTVTLKHSYTFMALQQQQQKTEDYTDVAFNEIQFKIRINTVVDPTRQTAAGLRRHSPPGRRL